MDCDHHTVVDTVTVLGIKGSDTAEAIRVAKGRWRGVYVAEDLPQTEWPPVLGNK